ncbi:MAG TPA: M20/M25/M40 family metallo-hydrolase, partial [Flavipsychrobacter sp.]|nr:M20/M25/M40 family metallo-hydrolase [Flavipsychrobacter sp.]
LPGFPLHQIVCKSGSFTSAVVSIAITFKGYTAHAAEPWNGRNPTVAIARFTLEALLLNKENKEQHRYITVTPVYTKVGSRNYGISAGEGTVHLTVRANDQQQLKVTLDQLRMIAEEQAAQQDLEVSFDYIEPFEANQNDEAVVTLIQQAAQANGFSYYEREEPFRWGEDFGLFTQVYKGAMFGIGSGESCPPLHHPAYDFPDAIIETGMKMFIAIQEKAQV